MIGSSARIQVNDLNDMQNHLREQVYAGVSAFIAECLILRPIRVHPVLNKTRSTANGELNYFDVDTSMGVSMMRKCVGKPIETLMRSSAIELPIGFQ